MNLLTDEIRAALPGLGETDKTPLEEKSLILKLFTPDSGWTWYATEFDGDDLFFGFVVGPCPEWDCFSLAELQGIKGPFGLHVERDRFWEPMSFSKLVASGMAGAL